MSIWGCPAQTTSTRFSKAKSEKFAGNIHKRGQIVAGQVLPRGAKALTLEQQDAVDRV
jgi:hypothetical protein